MDVKEIPLRVFEEMSKEFGKGEGNIISRLSIKYIIRELGDGGFIAYGEVPRPELKSQSNYFEVWPRLPPEDKSLRFIPVFLIVAGPIPTGSWVWGSGTRMKEDAVAHFAQYPFCIRNPLLTIISSALLFAQTQALLPDCQRAEYWEGDRCPEGTFEHPPE